MKGVYALEDPSFEQWQERGVFLAQVATTNVARSLARNFNNVLRSEDIMNAMRKAPFCLRIVREHRTEYAQKFRDAVAHEMRAIRANRF